MAKILVINTREHAIHLNVPGTASDAKNAKPFVPQEHVVIPAAKVDANNKKTNGQMVVESEHLEAARRNVVVQHYFKEGWLRTVESQKSDSK